MLTTVRNALGSFFSFNPHRNSVLTTRMSQMMNLRLRKLTLFKITQLLSSLARLNARVPDSKVCAPTILGAWIKSLVFKSVPRSLKAPGVEFPPSRRPAQPPQGSCMYPRSSPPPDILYIRVPFKLCFGKEILLLRNKGRTKPQPKGSPFCVLPKILIS